MSDSRLCYIGIYESAEDRANGEPAGWYLSMVKENEADRYQLSPGFGPYKDRESCYAHVEKMNERLGLTQEDIMQIIISSLKISKIRKA